jgi:hypothetical protein
VEGNPVNKTDPLGLFPGLGISCKIVGKIIIGFTKHGLNRMIQRKILPTIILDTLRNPQRIIKIIDETGRTSFQYIGDHAIIIINEFDQIITGWLKKSIT